MELDIENILYEKKISEPRKNHKSKLHWSKNLSSRLALLSFYKVYHFLSFHPSRIFLGSLLNTSQWKESSLNHTIALISFFEANNKNTWIPSPVSQVPYHSCLYFPESLNFKGRATQETTRNLEIDSFRYLITDIIHICISSKTKRYVRVSKPDCVRESMYVKYWKSIKTFSVIFYIC